jgi:transcription initiation factor IIE alpha subunit
MTTTLTDDRTKVRTNSKFSDRAFRINFALMMEMPPGWIAVSDIAEHLGMSSHKIRMALAELRGNGIIARQRRYETGDTGRKTWHTYVRLVDDNTTEADA